MKELSVDALEKIATDLGFKSYSDYANWLFRASEVMQRFGDSFVMSLGFLISHANIKNKQIITKAWFDLIDQNAKMFKESDQ